MTAEISRRRVLSLGGAAGLAAAVGPLGGSAATAAGIVVRPSGTVVGPGLPLFGFGSAHHLAGSNTNSWLRYARINAIRVFAKPIDWIKPSDVSVGGVTDLASFDAMKARVRSDPEATTYLNWPQILDRYENDMPTGTNKFVLNPMFRELNELGLTIVAQATLDGSWKMDWPDYWGRWQRGYAHAYYLAKNFGVVRFATHNEPDAWGSADQEARLEAIPNMDAFRRLLRFSSDAFRCGVEDAGLALGTSMRAIVHAPVVTRSTLHANGTQVDVRDTSDRTPTNIEKNPAIKGYWGNDLRDDSVGWGRAALEGIYTDYRGQVVDQPIFDVYDTHQYNEDASWYPGELDVIKAKVRQYAKKDLPIVYSEVNRYNTSWFDGVNHTLEYAPIARDVGQIAATSTHFGVGQNGGGLLFFKFSNTTGFRTGFYYTDETTARNDIRGATRGAESLRLFSRALVGDVDRISVPVDARPASFHVYGSYDAASHRHQLLTTQEGTSAVTFELDLSRFTPPVAADQVVTVEEVSARRPGGIARWVTVPADKRVSCVQPGDSTWLITVPDESVSELPPLTATQNALVRNGSDNADRALGGDTLAVQRKTNAADEVTFLRFDPAGPTTGTLSRAVLQIYGKVEANADICTFWVFARPNLDWDENTLTWNNAPYLPAGDSVLHNSGKEVWPAGQLSVTEDLDYHRLDVTDVVRELGTAPLTFILIKQSRYPTDTSQNDRQVTLLNRNYVSTWARPRLRLWTT